MWARKRLDIAWTDIAAGLAASLLPASAVTRARHAANLEAAAAPPAPSIAAVPPSANQALACLSVRTGFDLLWRTLALPAGSEVIFSALTIHDMPRIAAEHGLLPVPADIDLATLAPTRESLERARTPNTRALVVAHLCGARVDLTPAAEFARAHNLLLIEDCAQAYDGPAYTGDPRALVSMFSFGTIKSATAMGGAIFHVRDASLLETLRARHAAYRPAGRFWYLSRLVKNSAMKALSVRPWYGLFIAACRTLGKDYDKVINGSVRGFPGPEFFDRIRRQPPDALLRLLTRRLTRYNTQRLATRAALGARLAERIQPDWLCPAAASAHHNFWVFPVLSDNPPALLASLRQAGFDATQGQSLCAVAAPAGRENLTPNNAQRFLREVVFLPIYPELPPAAIDRLADAILHTAHAPATPTGYNGPVLAG
ncbi:MAG TPA: DegT/DnrJ/EryC1/StrS family aminotransferase [Planctomycetota bacterium]|nr:DegT/DnrJ/EryC1/StrS family aminotransferase [Planctomycetota bacterium]